ncbi:MAG: hypothetical protein AAFZ52_05450 [Bacteroidota bacterium]
MGGRYGYAANPGKLPDSLQQGDELILPQPLDLEGVVRAEVTLEKVLSHEDSRDLRIAINGHPPISVPEPAWIPEPQTEYMYHTDLTVPIPLEQLSTETPLRFRLTLDEKQRWDWPQNLFYGLCFRLYYAPAAAAPELAAVPQALPAASYLRLATPKDAVSANYILVGKNADWSGRGHQTRKHWQTHRGQAHHIIGQSNDAATDFAVRWDTEWLPDQDNIGVQARVLGTDGKYRVTAVTEGLRLAPRPYTVKLYAPGPAPRNWVTRSGEFSQTIAVGDSVERAKALQLLWTSWSPCYANGLFLNDHLIWDRTDDCYVFATHTPAYTGLEVKYLQPGENVLKTALTPLIGGHMVHGMEVQWPGIQLKVKYF